MATFSYEETYQHIVQIINAVLAKDTNGISAESTLQDLSIDSLDLVEMVIEIEDQFHCHMDDAKVEEMHTVGDIANYVFVLCKK